MSFVSAKQLEMQPSTNIIDAIAHQPGVSQITTGSGISKPVLGISKSTVSRALSGDTGNVKAETLQKILATAELGICSSKPHRGSSHPYRA